MLHTAIAEAVAEWQELKEEGKLGTEEEEEEDNLQRSEVKGEVFVMYIALVTVSLYDYRLRPTSAVLD